MVIKLLQKLIGRVKQVLTAPTWRNEILKGQMKTMVLREGQIPMKGFVDELGISTESDRSEREFGLQENLCKYHAKIVNCQVNATPFVDQTYYVVVCE
ncbi:hypothetical protein NPIL_96701 [Nephila pilipes]|uniref:Uncharacterized protein n=1 Tax=Nephila pilipes TaxID=299642 RepID=A0A8X6MJS2_NEPPI|nr:hypothetical protein NPIL_96701 [Nephila pilipes]